MTISIDDDAIDSVNEVDEVMNQDPEILTVAEHCREKLKCLDKEEMKLSNFYHSWRKRDVHGGCLRGVIGLTKSKMGA